MAVAKFLPNATALTGGLASMLNKGKWPTWYILYYST